MRLLRIKITDPKGFRSLQAGFEHHFRSEWSLQEEQGFAPFVCAGPNGSGKSNLLEALAAIFYHMECIYLENLPDSFRYDEETNPDGFQGAVSKPDAFELVYRFKHIDKNFYTPAIFGTAVFGASIFGSSEYSDRVRSYEINICKKAGKNPVITQIDLEAGNSKDLVDRNEIREVLPDYILGYSSGENEILSLPFFKMRYVQYDEYWQALKQQLPYPGRPESRLVYLDSGFSQAILLCNLLFQDEAALKLLCDDVEIQALKEFRIIIKRSIEIPAESAEGFEGDHPGLFSYDDETKNITIHLMALLEAGDSSADNFDPIVTRLKRCATCFYVDEDADTLYLDYNVNDATKKAFRSNFSNSPIDLFQAFQVLLTLNLYTVSETLKSDLYQSDSLYVGETVPVLASDQRIMRFKNFRLKKTDAPKPVLLKSLSDGEHQLLHSLGLFLLFRNTNSLFLLDEPETHFNPDWRANFATRLHECFEDSKGDHEMLVTTHTPFLISDSRPEKVLVFKKEDGVVSVSRPNYNTLGASINKITMTTFGKRETIGGRAQTMLDDFRLRFEAGEDKVQLMEEINHQLGDSVEKVLLIRIILDSMGRQG